MFDLNPLQNPDATWQHLIMFAGALIIGYLIGYIETKRTRQELEQRLHQLTSEVELCKAQKIPPSQDKPLSVLQTDTVQKKNDLKIIEGIGPIIEKLLNAEGIYTFTQLSSTPPEQLTKILQNSGSKFQMHDPRTWPQQANLAASERWEELKTLQNELNKGRYES